VPERRAGEDGQGRARSGDRSRIFDIVLMDVADLDSVRAGLADIDGSVDALVMNAGVIGPQSMALTADGVTTVFATNVLGHVVLLEGLLAEGRLGEVAVSPEVKQSRSSEVADEGAIVRFNLSRRTRHRHRRQLLRQHKT
jgi:NAD(P)-dependent dehydrogenase (short-subunit alcohol dehydrogenase family)